MNNDLFNKVVELTGLSPHLAPGVVERALRNVPVVPHTATTEDFRAALPDLRRRLQVYYVDRDVEARLRSIQETLDGEQRNARLKSTHPARN